MDFWEQFWPQFWGGIASGVVLASMTALVTFLIRKRIFRAMERHLGLVKDASAHHDEHHR